MSKEITITNANNQHKFICFRLKGLKDGITVGLYPNSDGLSIAYRGDVVGIPFNADSALIDELNDNSFPKKDEIENNGLYDTTWKLDNRNIIDSKLSGPVNATSYPLKTDWDIEADDKITTTLSMDKETYDWLTTPNEEDDDIGYWQPDQVTELDDEAFDAFEKEVMNPEPDMERVEAAKKIFEGVDKVINNLKIVETPVNAKTYPLKNQEIWMHEPVVLQNPEDFWKHERTHYGEPHLLELMDEWGVDGTNYADFRSVIQEHCFDKGLYAFDDIEKSWKSHVQSLKDVIKSIKKNGNN